MGHRRDNVMPDKQVAAPDNTAVRVALWRALHVEVDSPPHVLEDEVGLKLAAPDDGWRSRPDMSPFTRPFRASIVARARFIEDLVAEQVAHGVGQYVILGAGLDTFAQRRPELASRLLRSEEHTSELQSHHDLVCRLLLAKKKKHNTILTYHTKNYQLSA